MPTTEALVFVFIVALFADMATGIDAVPFFFVSEDSNRVYVIPWGFASGIMLATSIFGLLPEGAAQGPLGEVTSGALVGALLVYMIGHLLNEFLLFSSWLR